MHSAKACPASELELKLRTQRASYDRAPARASALRLRLHPTAKQDVYVKARVVSHPVSRLALTHALDVCRTFAASNPHIHKYSPEEISHLIDASSGPAVTCPPANVCMYLRAAAMPITRSKLKLEDALGRLRRVEGHLARNSEPSSRTYSVSSSPSPIWASSSNASGMHETQSTPYTYASPQSLFDVRPLSQGWFPGSIRS